MSLTIWKAQLELTTYQTIKVPAGAELLLVHEQNGEPFVWFRCDPDAPGMKENRAIIMTGTGTRDCPSKEEARYLGTAFCGAFVWHFFEEDRSATLTRKRV